MGFDRLELKRLDKIDQEVEKCAQSLMEIEMKNGSSEDMVK